MKKSPEIKQVSTKGSQGTQVGIQNINVGISPQEASELAINLFVNNFPKLQEEACRIARERVDELCGEIISRLKIEGVKDYSAFMEPDVQYILLEAQKNYARFGTKEMLEILSGLICKRIQNDKDLALKVTIDKAIEIAPMISSEQLDYLSLLFFCKRVVYRDITTLTELCNKYNMIAEHFRNADFDSVQYLHMLGCLMIHINSVGENYAEQIGLPKKEIADACPQLVKQIHGDYGPSYTGIVLAIMNAEIKTQEQLNLHIWIS